MTKQAPRPGTIATLVLFALSCFALLLFLWKSFGGAMPLAAERYQIQVGVREATQLGAQADVRIAGVKVGLVRSKELDRRTGRTLATLELESRYAPLRSDARATLRSKTLLGETYLELTPGSRTAAPLPEGARLPDAQVRDTVQLDEVLAALDEPTREAFQVWQRDFGRAVGRRGPDVNHALGHLPAVASGAEDLLRVLDRQRSALRGAIHHGGTVFAALGDDADALQRLVRDGRRVFDTTARRRDDLAATIGILPTTLAEARSTLRRTERFAHTADPVVEDLRTGVAELRPALGDLAVAAPDLRRVAARLDPVLDAARAGLPALGDLADGLRPLLGAAGPLLSEVNPLLEWLEYNQRLVPGFFNAPAGINSRTGSGGEDTNGHLLRAIAPVGLESVAFWNRRLPGNRGNTYLSPSAYADRRRASKMVLPSWDCANTGRGEFTTRTGGTTGDPSCWTLGWPGWEGKVVNGFPRLERADYGEK